MAKADLMQKGAMPFARQMMMFKENIGTYAVILGLSPEQVATQAVDADYYNQVVANHNLVQVHAQGWTALKKSLRRGKKSDVLESLPGLNLDYSAAPVPAGVEQRFRVLVRQIKLSPHYDLTMGVRLGIEATDRPAPDYSALQPKITAVVNGDRVMLGWDWQGFRAFLDQCEFQVDRNDGRGFGPLTHSTVPGSVDKTPFPAVQTVWRYRAIYHANNVQVGQWSQIVSVTVPQ